MENVAIGFVVLVGGFALIGIFGYITKAMHQPQLPEYDHVDDQCSDYDPPVWEHIVGCGGSGGVSENGNTCTMGAANTVTHTEEK